MSTISHAQEQNDEINLLSLFYQFLEHKWLIVLVTLSALALGVFYASRQIPQYQSDVLLQIEAKQQSFSQGGGAQQLFLGSQTADAASTQMALIQSRFILNPVIQLLGLDIQATPKRSFWSRLMSKQSNYKADIKLFEIPHELNNKTFNLVQDQLKHVQLFDNEGKLILQGKTGVLLSNLSQTIKLNVQNINAPTGTIFSLKKLSEINVIKNLSSGLKIKELGSQSRQNTGILTLSFIGPDVQKAIQILNTIAEVTQLKDAEKKSEEASQTLSFLYKQLPITKGQLENAEAALNRYRAKSGKINIKLQTTSLLERLTELDKKLTKLRIKKIDSLQKYTPEHPMLHALTTQTESLQQERTELEKQLKRLPKSDQIAVNLLRDVNVKKTLYLILLNKIQELQVLKAGTVSSVHILSKATIPDGPLPTKKSIIYLGSIFLGLFLSALIIFLRKMTQQNVADPQWSEQAYNIPNLAVVPFCEEQAEQNKKVKGNVANQNILLAHSNPRNLTIESLRSLRTSLQVSQLSATNNIISILGVTPGVGKSFVSTNLAYLLAAAGKRVVLIDCDLRRGTVHKYFNAAPNPGLAEVLKGSVKLEDALITALNENMTFLPRGVYPEDPSELLMGNQFKHILDILSKQYDVIIIDTAPVLLVTDAVLVAAHCAINYLVLGADTHHPDEIDVVIKRLASSNVNVNGTIFNFHKGMPSNNYGRYGRYGKYGKYNTYYDETLKT